MNRSCVRLLSVAVALLVAAPAFADVFKFSGAAEGADGQTLYQEQHTVEGSCNNGVFRPLEHWVSYVRQTAGGEETFAEKDLSYQSSDIRPTVSYQQSDFNESLEISYKRAEAAEILWQRPTGDKERSSVDVSDNLVVDAGFDNFVRRNWGKVVSGQSVKFRFLAPTRGTDYAFVLEPAQSQVVNADHVVQIRPDSTFLKFLVDPILLGYNNKGALTAYSGLTNVRENSDQNYTATIRYTVNTYPECALTP
ncbi:hypothetical protein [Marinobacter sp.]|uniref:hypothetical protein n=1 Tax=Marinobacter sp. TaxID=50741 RepID=UPI001B43D6BC|nr:hypothetical protein [Marinobacter sp.]MBQ0834444.1 hypothetical protein [Marinobacter sp.]